MYASKGSLEKRSEFRVKKLHVGWQETFLGLITGRSRFSYERVFDSVEENDFQSAVNEKARSEYIKVPWIH